MKVKNMVIIASFAALSVVLSLVKVWQMPNGGSISLYLVPLMFIAFKFDFKSSLTCCLITAILQIILSGYIIGFFQVILDYILPVCAISLFSLVRNKNVEFIIPVAFVIGILMLGSYVLSGMVYFKVNFIGSVMYNATFFIPTYLISIVLMSVLNKIKLEV
ncbi:MAG: energy-coupled thiamine transporter ThiT [Bacilli bacterium]